MRTARVTSSGFMVRSIYSQPDRIPSFFYRTSLRTWRNYTISRAARVISSACMIRSIHSHLNRPTYKEKPFLGGLILFILEANVPIVYQIRKPQGLLK